MTISSETRRAGPYSGNGSTVNFPFAFKVFTTAQVLVTRTVSGVETVLTLTTDYTVTLNADQNANPGGTVTMLVAPPVGHLITLTSNLANLQPTALANLGGFYPEVINDSLDRATIQIQQLDERLDRALVLPVSSSGIDTELPLPEANALIGWDGSATGLQNYSISPSGVSGPVFKSVGTYSGLQSLVPVTGDVVYVAGRLVANDGGGGHFEWVTGNQSSSVSGDPGKGIWVAPTSDLSGATGAWRRIFSGAVDAAWYGFSTTASAADNTTALNYALNYVRTFTFGGVSPSAENPAAIQTGPGVFNVTSVNATQIRGRAWRWDAYGTQLYSATDGAVVVDLTHSRGFSIRNLVVRGDDTTPPLRGFQTGYMAGAVSSGDYVLDNCQTFGKFEQAGYYNGGSEEDVLIKCRFRNTNSAATSYAGIMDGFNWWGKYSAYLTPSNGDHMVAAVTSVSAAATATVTTAIPHGLTTGEYVRFADVSGSTDVDGFDSFWQVLSTPSTTTFTIGGTNAAGGTGGFVWRTQGVSFVNNEALETAFFKDTGGPALWMTSNTQRFNFRGYLYSPNDDAVVVYFRPALLAVMPHGCVFDAAFEGSALKSMFRLTLGESTTNTFSIGGWEIKDHGPQNDEAVFKTNAAAGRFVFVGINVEISSFAGSSRNLVDTPARYRMQGRISTRNAIGITQVPEFDGELIVTDPNVCAVPPGACRVLSHQVGGIDSVYGVFKGRHRFYAGDAEILSLFGSNAYSEISGVGVTAPGLRSISTQLADDTANSLTLPAGNLGAGALIAIASATGTGLNGLYWVRGSASPNAVALTTATTDTTVTTGTLAGTTGADGDFTISAANDGKVYFENRRGSTITFSVTVLSAVL